MASRTVRRVLFVAAGVALCVAAFLRGNFLFGLEWGVLYVLVALGLLCLLARCRTPAGRLSPPRVAVVGALAVAVGLAMAWPTAVNPDVQVFIDKQAVDRAARSELAAVFATDAAYESLWVSSVHVKAVNVTVRGSLGTRAELDRLRARIIRECPEVTRGGCVLHWDVMLRYPEQRIEGLDSELFDTHAGRG